MSIAEVKMKNNIEIRVIDAEHRNDINIKNEPFSLYGRLIPSYVNGKWDYAIINFDGVDEMCFPNENYDYNELSKNSTFIGAYYGARCIGLAIMQEAMFKHMYLYDLKVDRECRRRGVARALLDRADAIAAERGYIGIYTQGQDNNLGACLFYLNCGFVIGGFDQKVYEGTEQEGKADIYFYRRSSSGQ